MWGVKVTVIAVVFGAQSTPFYFCHLAMQMTLGCYKLPLTTFTNQSVMTQYSDCLYVGY